MGSKCLVCGENRVFVTAYSDEGEKAQSVELDGQRNLIIALIKA